MTKNQKKNAKRRQKKKEEAEAAMPSFAEGDIHVASFDFGDYLPNGVFDRLEVSLVNAWGRSVKPVMEVRTLRMSLGKREVVVSSRKEHGCISVAVPKDDADDVGGVLQEISLQLERIGKMVPARHPSRPWISTTVSDPSGASLMYTAHFAGAIKISWRPLPRTGSDGLWAWT